MVVLLVPKEVEVKEEDPRSAWHALHSFSRSRRAAAGRAQLLANFVHELDDVWPGSWNRPGTVPEPWHRVQFCEILVKFQRNFIKIII